LKKELILIPGLLSKGELFAGPENGVDSYEND
jgi:hypothetical protein